MICSGHVLVRCIPSFRSNPLYTEALSVCRYLVFYCPVDAVYSLASILPVRLVLTGMKEVTRTWKVLGGVTQAGRKYKDGLFVMIAVGWAKGTRLILIKTHLSVDVFVMCSGA